MSSSPLHSHLTDALRERIAVVADRELFRTDPSLHLERLKTVSEKISAIQSQLPSPVDPRLAHYLQRCSYQKALEFLEAECP